MAVPSRLPELVKCHHCGVTERPQSIIENGVIHAACRRCGSFDTTGMTVAEYLEQKKKAEEAKTEEVKAEETVTSPDEQAPVKKKGGK